MFPRLISLAAAVAALSLPTALAMPTAVGAPAPAPAEGSGVITVEQLNMCMWGSVETAFCYPNGRTKGTAAWTTEERRVARLKRDAVITQFRRHTPDVITVNEGCLGDLRTVASAIGYELAYQDTGSGTDHKPRNCTAGRGIGVNAILARSVRSTGPAGYYEEPGYRSYLCAGVSTQAWPSVRVCTSHLSLKSQGAGRQARECASLRSTLAASREPTVFAGDVNMLGTQNCVPSGFHGLRDRESTAAGRAANPTDGLQHIYYGPGFWRQSCGWSYSVGHTDHKGFLLELGTRAPAGGAASCRRLIP